MGKTKLKNFEIEIKTTIVYPTWDHVELFDFESDVLNLIQDLFEETEIEIKKGNLGWPEIEILGVKEEAK